MNPAVTIQTVMCRRLGEIDDKIPEPFASGKNIFIVSDTIKLCSIVDATAIPIEPSANHFFPDLLNSAEKASPVRNPKSTLVTIESIILPKAFPLCHGENIRSL